MRKVIFFHGADCPHCKHMMPIVEEIEKDMGIRFDKKEVWYNEDNEEYMREFADVISEASIDGDLGVPAFVDPENMEALVGEQLKEDLKNWIKEK